MEDKEKIYNMLGWKSTRKVQEEGIRLAREIEDISVFIMPHEPPMNWACCAQILAEKPDSVLEPYLLRLLKWLKVFDWPGAPIILDRLKRFSGEKLKAPFLELVTYAIELKNQEGLMWLDSLSDLLDNEQLKAVLPKEVAERLQKHYHNHGFWWDREERKIRWDWIEGDYPRRHTIYDMLYCNEADEAYKEGMRLARELEDISLLIMPPALPLVWERCAQILSEKSDSILEPYLPQLLEWLQDLNWPGALVILDRLKLFSGEKLKTPFLELVTYAIGLKSEEGLMWLDSLSELLDNGQLKAMLPKEVTKTLQKHYHNCGFWWDDEEDRIRWDWVE